MYARVEFVDMSILFCLSHLCSRWLVINANAVSGRILAYGL